MPELLIKDFTQEEFIENYRKDKPFDLFSPSEMNFIMRTSPNTIERFNSKNGTDLTYALGMFTEEAIALAGFLTTSIDRSIFHDIMNVDMAKSKIGNLSKLFEALSRAKNEELDVILSKDDVNSENFIDYAFLAKHVSLKIIENYSKGQNHHRMADIRNSPNKKIGEFFETIFGDNLDAIIQYGSSLNGGGKDIDLMVFLNEINVEIYRVMRGMANIAPFEKDLGVVLLPSWMLHKYSEADMNSYHIWKEGIFVHGDYDQIPIPKEQTYVDKEYLKSFKNFKTLRNAAEHFGIKKSAVRSQDFRDWLFKNELWLYKNLLQKELGRFVSKNEAIATEGYTCIKFDSKPKLSEIESQIYSANMRVKDRIYEHAIRMNY